MKLLGKANSETQHCVHSSRMRNQECWGEAWDEVGARDKLGLSYEVHVKWRSPPPADGSTDQSLHNHNHNHDIINTRRRHGYLSTRASVRP
jgi:hypothetical protein